jgi:hypothetical protein
VSGAGTPRYHGIAGSGAGSAFDDVLHQRQPRTVCQGTRRRKPQTRARAEPAKLLLAPHPATQQQHEQVYAADEGPLGLVRLIGGDAFSHQYPAAWASHFRAPPQDPRAVPVAPVADRVGK